MKKTYIAVMDYSTGSIQMWEHDFPNGAQYNQIEEWLSENTGYSQSQCYYMASDSEIEVNYHKE